MKKSKVFVCLVLLVCMLFPAGAAFADDKAVSNEMNMLTNELNLIIPQAFTDGYAEKTIIVDGVERTISAKLEELDDDGNVVGLASEQICTRSTARVDAPGFYMYKATPGAKRLTLSADMVNGSLYLYTDFTISDGLSSFTNVSNGVYAEPITSTAVISKDSFIEEETYRSFTSHGTATWAIATQVPVSGIIEAFFYLDYPIGGDWDEVYYTVNATAEGN